MNPIGALQGRRNRVYVPSFGATFIGLAHELHVNIAEMPPTRDGKRHGSLAGIVSSERLGYRVLSKFEVG
jgi:hypothetical protein